MFKDHRHKRTMTSILVLSSRPSRYPYFFMLYTSPLSRLTHSHPASRLFRVYKTHPTLSSRTHHSNWKLKLKIKLKHLHKTHPQCATILIPPTPRLLTSLSSSTALGSLARYVTSLSNSILTISTGSAILAVVL
jgi:hypothetical protein